MDGPENQTTDRKDVRMQVLLMEDDPGVAKGLQMILREEGFGVDVAGTGQGALDMFNTGSNGRFDLLVADLRLPDMDGMDVVRQVKDARPETQVIVITGYGNVNTAVDAMKMGAMDYLMKPFSEEDFMNRVRDAVAKHCLPGPETEGAEEETETPASPRVLVVEDDPGVARGLRMVLEERGCEVITAESGQAAMERMAESGAELLVVDMRLPDMNGLKVITHAGKCLPDMPVIVITGYSSVPGAVEALRMGVADYLEKPFTEETFIHTVEKALAQSDNAENFVRRTAETAASVRTGFYICHGGGEISKAINMEELAAFAADRSGVAVSRSHSWLCRDAGLEQIQKDIEALGLNRMVVAACAPAVYEKRFRDACVAARLKPDHFQLVPLREQVSWTARSPEEARQKARSLSAAAIHRVTYPRIHPPRRVAVHPDVLVVGGGIAGMQAALDVARSGNPVHLVEKSSTIGGHMLQFDKTFPTLDCAACIGTPVMVEVGQHPKIDLMTCSEVTNVEGHVGNYRVTVRRSARYVDEKKCTGCGECETVCPVSRPSEWDVGLKNRSAIYRCFPQAVPIAYVIDKRGTAPCKAACPAHVSVQGFIALINAGKYAEAIRLFRKDHPFPGVCGRVCHHPCEADCSRKDHDDALAIGDLHRFLADWEAAGDEIFLPEAAAEKRSEKIAIIGSGPSGLSAGYFLALKGYSPTIYEALSVAGGWMAAGIPGYRLPEDVLSREIDIIQKTGVEIRTNVTFGRDITFDSLLQEGYSAVFMGIGLQKGRRISIENEDAPGVIQGLDFLRDIALGKPPATGNKVVVIGGGNVAFDCARTIVRMGAARVTIVYRRTRKDMPAHEDEILAAENEGIECLFLAAPTRIIQGKGDAGSITGIEYIRMSPGKPDASGRPAPEPVEGSETVLDADTVILAIGQEADTGNLSDDRLAMTAYGYIDADPDTLQTPLKWVFAGGDAVYGPKSVVDAVASGKRAAESIDRFILEEDLHESRDKAAEVARPDTPPAFRQRRRSTAELPVSERSGNFYEVRAGYDAEHARLEAARCMECAVCAECYQCVGACEPGAIDHTMEPEYKTITVGSIIVATGFDLMNPKPLKSYGYGKYPNVFTSLEFERLNNATGPTGGEIRMRNDSGVFDKKPQSVALIHCAGSRDVHFNDYCSRVCCMYALKYSHLIKEKLGHNTEVYDFSIDMRCYGKGYEEFYRRCQEEGTRFIRSRPAAIQNGRSPGGENGRLVVAGEDTLLNRPYRIPVDMVVLCSAIEPGSDAQTVAERFGIRRGKDGFFQETQGTLSPLCTGADGIFIAGACQSPKDISDSVSQASGAAGRALELAMGKSVEIPYTIAWIDPEACDGCRTCLSVCEVGAVAFDNENDLAMVNPAVCKGCGQCVALCPAGAAHIWQFRENRILTESDDAGLGLLAMGA